MLSFAKNISFSVFSNATGPYAGCSSVIDTVDSNIEQRTCYGNVFYYISATTLSGNAEYTFAYNNSQVIYTFKLVVRINLTTKVAVNTFVKTKIAQLECPSDCTVNKEYSLSIAMFSDAARTIPISTSNHTFTMNDSAYMTVTASPSNKALKLTAFGMVSGTDTEATLIKSTDSGLYNLFTDTPSAY